jgi:hypothetical protein
VSNEGALRNFDSSMFNTRFCEVRALVPAVVLALLLLVERFPLQLWLNSCQGTGINFPVMVEPLVLLGVPVVLDRLEGTVSLPDVAVSDAAPAEESDKTAN